MIEHHDETDPLELFAGQLPDEGLINEIQVGEPSSTYRHKLTHQLISARFLILEPAELKAFRKLQQVFELGEFEVSDLHQLPKPILINNYLKADIF
jgi:A/G-specific adenine glycosylase